MADAAMRGNRHASGDAVLNQADRSAAKIVAFQERAWIRACRTSLSQFLDNYFPPAIRRGLVRLV